LDDAPYWSRRDNHTRGIAPSQY